MKGHYCAASRVYPPTSSECVSERTLTLCPSNSDSQAGSEFVPYNWAPDSSAYEPEQRVLRRRAQLTLDCYYKNLRRWRDLGDDYLVKCKLKD